MKRNLFSLYTVLFVLSCTVYSHAQRPEEILNYSRFGTHGSARVMGLAGAMNAIGADASLISYNPAALGGFWKSEISFGLGLATSETTSSLNGSPRAIGNQSNFQFGHLAYVHSSYDRDRKVQVQNFSIGINRLADFDNEFVFEANNPGSITEYWLAAADGLAPDQLNNFQEGLAYDAEALYDDGEFYYTDYLGRENTPLNKRQLVQESGYNNEFFIAYGINLDNKWQFGASLGIPFFEYSYSKQYQELATPEYIATFDDTTARMAALRLDENLQTTGIGINLKLGALYKFNNSLRATAAIHTPTLYTVSDEGTNDIRYSYVEDGMQVDNSAQSPLLFFEYAAVSAWRGIVGLGYLFPDKQGFIDAELEYIGYDGSRYDLTFNDNSSFVDQANEDFVNEQIKDQFHNTINLKLGGEYAMNNLRLRAGVNLNGSPYSGNTDFDTGYGLGIGYRGDKFYIDGAYASSSQDRRYEPYPVDGFNEQVVTQTLDQNQFMVTVGFKL